MQVLIKPTTHYMFGASLLELLVKNPPANEEDTGSIPGLEYTLEEVMATHSRILAWRIPWTEQPGGLQHIQL